MEEKGTLHMPSKVEKKILIKCFYAGESARSIAQERNIPLPTLYYWTNKNRPLRANRLSRFTQAEYCELQNKVEKLENEVQILQKFLDYVGIVGVVGFSFQKKSIKWLYFYDKFLVYPQ